MVLSGGDYILVSTVLQLRLSSNHICNRNMRLGWDWAGTLLSDYPIMNMIRE